MGLSQEDRVDFTALNTHFMPYPMVSLKYISEMGSLNEKLCRCLGEQLKPLVERTPGFIKYSNDALKMFELSSTSYCK